MTHGLLLKSLVAQEKRNSLHLEVLLYKNSFDYHSLLTSYKLLPEDGSLKIQFPTSQINDYLYYYFI